MKFSFLKETTQALIGVDISSASIKMVELSDDGRGGYKLDSYSTSSLPRDAMVDGNVNDLEKVVDAMKKAWKLLASRKKRVALALPAASVISKIVQMSAGLREEDMEAQVEAEANQYIPFSLDEVNIDFQVLGPSANNSEEVDVLIAASRKEKIEDRVAAAEGAGLKAAIMDVESYATEAAYTLVASQLPNSGREQTVMIADIGASMMNITVLQNNISVYTREQSFGGAQLTKEIQRRFGLSLEEAQIAKRKGGLPESYDAELLQPFVQSLSMEVARALQFFTSSTQYHRVDHIVLAGGCAAIPAIDIAVKNRTQVNTIVANPFHSMTISAKLKPQQVVLDAPALLIACGLAMRGLPI